MSAKPIPYPLFSVCQIARTTSSFYARHCVLVDSIWSPTHQQWVYEICILRSEVATGQSPTQRLRTRFTHESLRIVQNFPRGPLMKALLSCKPAGDVSKMPAWSAAWAAAGAASAIPVRSASSASIVLAHAARTLTSVRTALAVKIVHHALSKTKPTKVEHRSTFHLTS